MSRLSFHFNYLVNLIFVRTELVPSEWTGNYTCPDDGVMTWFLMNITRSTNIETLANVKAVGIEFPLSGSYATVYQIITLQNDVNILREGTNMNYTDVELDGRVLSSVYIKGYLVFKKSNTTLQCPVELRRTAVHIDWCSNHGRCFRNGKNKNDVSCCCEPDHKGQFCEIGPTTPTPPTTTVPPCYPKNDCYQHYSCGARGQKVCLPGNELVPSEWTGNYTCPDEGVMTWFLMNITRSTNIETLANVKVANTSFPLSGSYATVFQIITLMNDIPILREANGYKYIDVELDGTVKSPVFINGYIVFKNGNRTMSCDVELRRTAININWCSGKGTCYRNSKAINDYKCCCRSGYSGRLCDVLPPTTTTIPPTTSTTTTKTTLQNTSPTSSTVPSSTYTVLSTASSTVLSSTNTALSTKSSTVPSSTYTALSTKSTTVPSSTYTALSSTTESTTTVATTVVFPSSKIASATPSFSTTTQTRTSTVPKTTTPSTTTTTTAVADTTTTTITTKAPVTTVTQPRTTTITHVPCTPIETCGAHFTCDRYGRKSCSSGWTGSACNVMVPGGEADCDMFG
ncbi:hypothetical protein MAR_037151, partial [Mya arenaria]